MKKLLTGVMLLFCSTCFCAADNPQITDSFKAFAKLVVNPFDSGFDKVKGRFYPYSSRYGRRIAYETCVPDKKYFKDGIDKEQADELLTQGLQTALAALKGFFNEAYPQTDFNALNARQKEMLLIRFYAGGKPAMSDAYCRAVLADDMKLIISQMLYVYAPEGWLDRNYNKAFFFRFFKEDGTLKE